MLWGIAGLWPVLVLLVQHIVGVPAPAVAVSAGNGAFKHVAVIVEPREHGLLVPVVRNVLRLLPAEWQVQIFHGTRNLRQVADAPELQQPMTSGRVVLSNLGVANLHLGMYNALLTNASFWRACLAEKVLLFQTDTAICEHSGRHIDDFVHLDFVGAPWPEYSWWLEAGAVPTPLSRAGRPDAVRLPLPVGNGGFTLRSRSVMLSVLALHEWDGVNMEDVWFSHMLQSAAPDEPFASARIATLDEARSFALESQYAAGAFGVHMPQRYLSRHELDALYRYCPGAHLIERHENNPAAKAKAPKEATGSPPPLRASLAADIPGAGLGFTAECTLQLEGGGRRGFPCTAAQYGAKSQVLRGSLSVEAGFLMLSRLGGAAAATACSAAALGAIDNVADLRGAAVGAHRGECPFSQKVTARRTANRAKLPRVDDRRPSPRSAPPFATRLPVSWIAAAPHRRCLSGPTQAQNLQRLGVAAVVLIDNQDAGDGEAEDTPAAPGLGDTVVDIPVVMVAAHQGETLGAAGASAAAERLISMKIQFVDAEVRLQPQP